jgi:adenylate cyclase
MLVCDDDEPGLPSSILKKTPTIEPASLRGKVTGYLDQVEAPMLWLAAFAIVIYLGELKGLWMSLGLFDVYRGVALAVDAIFVIDVLVKVWALRMPYVRSPWFAIDLISALPIVASLSAIPDLVHGLRFMRGFRMFRMLRTLRWLRKLPGLRGLKSVPVDHSPETRNYHRALLGAVLIYTAVFVCTLAWVKTHAPPGAVIEVDGTSVAGHSDYTLTIHDGHEERTVVMRPEYVFKDGHEIEFFLVTGSLLGMLLIMLVVRFQLPDISARQIRALLNVALPMQVASHFMENPHAYNNTVRMPATVIFCDIRGFTATVERLGGNLDELKMELERAMDAVVDIHIEHDLIVDKFIGDAIMSFRGGDLVTGGPRDHAERVVRATLHGHNALTALDNPYFREMKVGGASGSDALIGTFGTSKRLSYTILGDRVNLAARLEAACNSLGLFTLFCSQTRALCDKADDVVWRKVGAMKVKGKQQIEEVYEAFLKDTAGDMAWRDRFEAALLDYNAQRFAEARTGFAEVEGMRGRSDGPSEVYIAMCDDALKSGVPDDWSPVLTPGK